MPIDFYTDQLYDGTNPIEYFVQFDTGETFPLVETDTPYLFRLYDEDIVHLAAGEHTACVLREGNTEPDSIVGVVPSFVWNG